MYHFEKGMTLQLNKSKSLLIIQGHFVPSLVEDGPCMQWFSKSYFTHQYVHVHLYFHCAVLTSHLKRLDSFYAQN